MHQGSSWLSEDAHALQNRLEASKDAPCDCDVLIVGSGYGGAVAAARLAAMTNDAGSPLSVIVVERGREYLPGMFPSRTADLPAHARYSRQDGKQPEGPATALWDIRLGNDVNVVLASGLGGGSLINAAVMERPEPEVWRSGWPSGIDGDVLDGAYKKVSAMLQANPLPAEQQLPKLSALQHLSDGLPGSPRVQRCQIAVSFKDQVTPDAGVERKACKLCGDCATGCNWQAKNSLDSNYLALAKHHNVGLYCGVLARQVRRRGAGKNDGWDLLWAPTDTRLGWHQQRLVIRARKLILCAGSLGSTELLQRSQTKALRFSPTLGSRFSTNGDMIAAAVKLPKRIKTQICANETVPFESRNVGPTITGMLRSGHGEGRFVAQEFSIPAPLRTLLAELTGSLGLLHDLPRHDYSLHSPWKRGSEPLSPGPAELDRTMVYGLMGDDGARGRLEPTRPLDDQGELSTQMNTMREDDQDFWDGRIAVQWPEARQAAVFNAQHEAFSRAYGSRRRGRYLPNPAWRPLPPALDVLAKGKGVRGPITTVHPLGGCPMGDTVEQGVVNAKGQVFDAGPVFPGDAGVFGDLVVLDGAIVPRALGINPALTIAALAEHAVERLIADWGFKGSEPIAPRPAVKQPVWQETAPRPEQPTTSVHLREKLEGTLEFGSRRYWAELQVRFAPIDDVAEFARRLPRRTAFERVSLRLFDDRIGLDDEPEWRAQRHLSSSPRWEVELEGEADVMFRHWSWWGCRLWRSVRKVKSETGPAGKSLPLWTRLAIASNIGEKRGIDYRLRVRSTVDPSCPLQAGDLLLGRKVIENDLDANPWRQVSEMALQWRRPGVLSSYRKIGDLTLDLRYFVRQRITLLALLRQSDMVTALADIGAFGLFCLRVLLKIHLLKFIPPDKVERSTVARRPAELPGLRIDERIDWRAVTPPRKVLLTSYVNPVDATVGPPVVLFHGFTASGSTFAHPTIANNLVQYLCAQRRKVWVVELPTSIAFDKRDAKDMSFEKVAQEIPAVIKHIAAGKKVDVLGHCIGSAMFCRAVLGDPSLHESVNSAVLSQVGPLIQMSPANLLRGYIASYLARYIGTDTLDARPSFEPGAAEGLGQTLLDALLASLPYPRRDRERVLAEAAKAAGRPDFRLVRHRADAMLGQLFELTDDSTVASATLDALDDILGYARVQTLAQIIHYTRFAMLTDADGRNRDLTQNNLKQRMPFPVLLLHGRRSGVFDWRGSLESYEWLRRSSPHTQRTWQARAERDDDKLHLGLNTSRQLCVFEKLGHQDSIIGERAASVVFPVIGEFLRSIKSAETQCQPTQHADTPPDPWIAELPWTGPIVGWLRESGKPGQLTVSLVLRPSPAHASTRFVAVVSMQRQNGTWKRDLTRSIRLWNDLDKQPSPIGPVLASIGETDADATTKPNERLDLGEEMQRRALQLFVDPADVDGVSTALLFLTIHDDMPLRVPDLDPLEASKLKVKAEAAVRQFLHTPPENLESGLLRLPTGVTTARDGHDLPAEAERTLSLTFALGSCQYPAGILDRELSQASYRRLSRRLDSTGMHGGAVRVPQLLLLLGDQVYVDETAGLFEPPAAEFSFDEVYDRAFRAPAFREVTSRLPTFMMLDDHEVADNWQPPDVLDDLDALCAPRARHARPVDEEIRALCQYKSRQAVLNPPAPPGLGGARRSFTFCAAPGGWPLYVMDTRLTREPRRPETFDGTKMVSDREMDSLLDWLKTRDASVPKFVATPGVLLPFESGIEQPHWHSDAWAGYPASRARLLGEIVRHKIRNVVFLAGDAHLSMVSQLTVQVGETEIVMHSIVSSALYSPWRFANNHPSHYVPSGPVEVPIGNGETLAGEMTTFTRETNGFAVVSVLARRDGSYRLVVEFDPTEGNEPFRFILPRV
jgi:cholesterol oxidase